MAPRFAVDLGFAVGDAMREHVLHRVLLAALVLLVAAIDFKCGYEIGLKQGEVNEAQRELDSLKLQVEKAKRELADEINRGEEIWRQVRTK